MSIFIGLLIIAIGSFGQSSSYVPIKKVKDWAWECFWLTQGIFAWLVFPFLGSLLAVPNGETLFGIIGLAGNTAILKTIGFGMLWGIGGLTFGLSMRYLGVAMGQSIALGTCSAFGTLIPAIIAGKNLFSGNGLILLIAVSIAIAGIAVIGYAGALRSQNMTEEEKRKAVKDFALKKGLLIALLCGVMSACFNLGLEAGVKEAISNAVENGTLDISKFYVGLPATLLVTIGGFLVNAIFCITENVRNKTGKQYFSVPGNVLINNVLFCALAGILWYSQFFGFSVGTSYFPEGSVMLAFSWSILMSLNILFSNFWGIILKEWKGAGNKAVAVLIAGLLILILSIVFTGISQQ